MLQGMNILWISIGPLVPVSQSIWNALFNRATAERERDATYLGKSQSIKDPLTF